MNRVAVRLQQANASLSGLHRPCEVIGCSYVISAYQ